MFEYPADRLPVAIILCVSAIDFLLYFFVNDLSILLTYWAVMIIPKGKICAWNHHHQHTPTFKSKPLNRLLEFFYALHTGVTTHLWLLHHVLGHHHHYMDQTKDESRWKRRSGKTMGVVEYTFNAAITSYYRGYKVGQKHPKAQRVFITYTAITLFIVLLLTVYKPLPALLLFVFPMIMGVLLTSWATYEHHAGLDTDNEFEASRNNMNRFYNLTTGNLGYHTAHHYRQGMHWSALPALHEQIKHKIPARLIKNSIF